MTWFRPYSLLFLLWLTIGQPGYVFAKMTLTSSLLVREEYDDNIYLDPAQEVDDFITLVTPGLKVDAESKTVRASMDSRFELRFYQDDSTQNRTSWKDVLRLRAAATLFPERDFRINFLDDFSPVVINERRPTSENNPLINKANRNLFEVKPEYRLRQFKKIEPGIAYRYRAVNYTRGSGDDSESHRVDTDVITKTSQRLRFKARYGIEQFSSTSADDYDRHDIVLGLEAEPWRRVSLGLEAGRGWIDVEKADTTSSLLVNTWLKLQLSSRTLATIDYRQNFLNSVENGLVKEQRGATTLSYATERTKMQFEVFASKEDYQQLSLDDRSAGVRLTSDLSLGRRTSLGVSGFQTWYRFKEATGDIDDVSRRGAGTWLGYQLRILSLRAGYRYEENNSERDSNDYVSNVVYVEAGLRY